MEATTEGPIMGQAGRAHHHAQASVHPWHYFLLLLQMLLLTAVA